MSKQVVILGGGVIGLCTALYTARRGHRVTVIERCGAERDGCSFGNAGLIVPSHFTPLAAPGMVALGLRWMWNPESPFWIKPSLDPDLLRWVWLFWRAATPGRVAAAAPLLRDLSLRSRALFEELATACDNEFGLAQSGLLMLCQTQHGFDDEARMAERARALGLRAEVLEAREVAALEPGVAMHVTGAVHYAQDCHLAPQRLMATLQRMCVAAGVTFVWGAEIHGFTCEAKKVRSAETSRGEFTADEFVLCAGAWSGVIARKLDLRLPMQAGKGCSLTLPQPPRMPQRSAILTEARVAVTPLGDSLRFGGTMEIDGLREGVNARRVRGLVKAAVRYYPEFAPSHFEGIEPWSGLRPCSPDGLPFLGRTARWANVCVAAGHGMMGLSLGPVSGEVISALLEGRETGVNERLLSPDRFSRR